MTDRPAVITGSLVDAKNVHTHKSLRLIIDVPAEHAQKVFEAFGWPTMASPVSVAVARLSETAEQRSNHSAQGGADSFRVSEGSRPASASPASDRKPLLLASKIAMTCGSLTFQRWLKQSRPSLWGTAAYRCEARGKTTTEDEIAAELVRIFCGVESRREISGDRYATDRWGSLTAEFEMWQREEAA